MSLWIVTSQATYESEAPEVVAFWGAEKAYRYYQKKRGGDKEAEFSINTTDIEYSDGQIIVSLKCVNPRDDNQRQYALENKGSSNC